MPSGSPFQQVRDEISRFARDRATQEQLRTLMDRAEAATTPDALRPVITQAIAIMKQSATDSSCEENCQRQYDNCVASCTDTSCITRCFGRYVLCMRSCQS
jgi:hypothetical protein